LKGLWSRVQNAVDEVLSKTTLGDLLRSAEELETAACAEPQDLLQVSGLKAAAVTLNR
jgi:DNA-binding IscR family transcriptional regulator